MYWPNVESTNRSSQPSDRQEQIVRFEHPWASTKKAWRHRLSVAGLLLLVHLDGLRRDPTGYLEAAFWRLRGLKVRSRHRMGPILGHSRYAYPLWIARQSLSSRFVASEPGPIEITPVIDCRDGAGLEATLASIGSSGAAEPIFLGGTPPDSGRHVDRVRDLERYFPNGGWICPLRAGDVLAPGALNAYSQAIDQGSATKLVYADDDLVDAKGRRHSPHFKPRWNSDLFDHHDFLSASSVAFVQAQTLAALPDHGWMEKVVAEAIGAAPPLHLPLMLHHRRARPAPAIPAKAMTSHLGAPAVTVIIPTRDHAGLLRNCINGLETTDYSNVKIIVVDNDSVERETLDLLNQLKAAGHTVLPMPGPYNYSKLNNEAVRQAEGSILCFLNNDVEMIDRDWLPQMVRHATRPDIGAVGALLLYPDRTIQHAGVVIGIGGGAGHAHRYLGEDEHGYFDRARLPQKVSAVTGACMVVEREKFLAVGGFEEDLFPVAFNDVDLCLKLNSRGWQSFYEPRARLVHHESKSRGHDSLKQNRSRFAGELAALKAKWQTDEALDPYHHPALSSHSEQFVMTV